MAWHDYSIERTPHNKTSEYQAITKFYGNRRARRSKVPYMNHINEGIVILEQIQATDNDIRAFCLHPIVQMDVDLEKNWSTLSWVHSDVMMCVMEYRNKANAYLCLPEMDSYTYQDLPSLPLESTRKMLIADKVQNYKDFLTYHVATHERSKQLDQYFRKWLRHLGVCATEFDRLTKLI